MRGFSLESFRNVTRFAVNNSRHVVMCDIMRCESAVVDSSAAALICVRNASCRVYSVTTR